MVSGSTTVTKETTLTFATTSAPSQPSPMQPKKSLRWAASTQRARKERPRKGHSRPTFDSQTSSHLEYSGSSDDATSPSSDDSPSKFGGSGAPYRYGITIHPALHDSINVQTRGLFSHFSEAIASHMVVLDSFNNGYRNIILPLACQDNTLGQAVSVASAFHLGQKDARLQHLAQVGHQAILEKLRRDAFELSPERLFNPYTLATILVLLVSETVTGADNYVYLLEMLNCLTQFPDWISKLLPNVRDFFLEQIKMFQLFGVPLANESKAIKLLTGPEAYLNFIAYPELSPQSEHFNTMQTIRFAIFNACKIYSRRAESSLSDDESIHLIEQLRQKVAHIGPTTKGAHALVWTYFIAASESILPEHREFFSTRLASLYNVTHFGSIPVAVKALGTIWSMQGMRRWTEIVSSEMPVLIM
ncbi:hypothetical protein FPRO05_14231 [Fusarium proliferatum]|uniref:Acriflavine sensitivity control protein acr-2 n=1 Tax=Gibberella intermedia TaxID=948311 RepID=A0A365MTB5_GIBIN|nr:hypothetical protein FPRO05_14231 [Fusarium proliferatum]